LGKGGPRTTGRPFSNVCASIPQAKTGEETLTEVVLLAAAPNSFREMKNYTKELIFSPRFIIFFRFLASEISCQQ